MCGCRASVDGEGRLLSKSRGETIVVARCMGEELEIKVKVVE